MSSMTLDLALQRIEIIKKLAEAQKKEKDDDEQIILELMTQLAACALTLSEAMEEMEKEIADAGGKPSHQLQYDLMFQLAACALSLSEAREEMEEEIADAAVSTGGDGQENC
jgi:hypothetical protein